MPGTTSGQFVRSILEAVAASLKILLTEDDKECCPERVLATGGGAHSDLWLQIKADILGTVMVAIENPEPACTGAAILAARASGWLPSLEKLPSGWVKVRKEFYPDADTSRYYRD